jgi:hypothetical protein
MQDLDGCPLTARGHSQKDARHRAHSENLLDAEFTYLLPDAASRQSLQRFELVHA